MKSKEEKIDLKKAFQDYAKKELEFYKTAEKDKLYHRVMPNLKEKINLLLLAAPLEEKNISQKILKDLNHLLTRILN